jgi:hypothetical protein
MAGGDVRVYNEPSRKAQAIVSLLKGPDEQLVCESQDHHPIVDKDLNSSVMRTYPPTHHETVSTFDTRVTVLEGVVHTKKVEDACPIRKVLNDLYR